MSKWFQRHWLTSKALVVVLIVTSLIVGCAPQPTPSDTSFTYQVRVQDQDTGEAIEGADVTIAIGGDIAPVDDVTDLNGIAMIPIDSSRAGKLGRLTVTASGYDKYDKYVNLTGDALPNVVQLAPIP